jgi:hypothetical protein
MLLLWVCRVPLCRHLLTSRFLDMLAALQKT